MNARKPASSRISSAHRTSCRRPSARPLAVRHTGPACGRRKSRVLRGRAKSPGKDHHADVTVKAVHYQGSQHAPQHRHAGWRTDQCHGTVDARHASAKATTLTLALGAASVLHVMEKRGVSTHCRCHLSGGLFRQHLGCPVPASALASRSSCWRRRCCGSASSISARCWRCCCTASTRSTNSPASSSTSSRCRPMPSCSGSSNLDVILRSLVMAIAVTIACAIMAFPISYYAARYARGKWKALFYLLVMLPLWSSYLVKVYAWKLILAKEGIISWLAEQTASHLAARRASWRFRSSAGRRCRSATSAPSSSSATSGCPT